MSFIVDDDGRNNKRKAKFCENNCVRTIPEVKRLDKRRIGVVREEVEGRSW